MTTSTFAGALSGTASVASTVTINQDYSTNAGRYIPFVDGVTGNLNMKTDNGLYYNPSTQIMTTSIFQGTSRGHNNSNQNWYDFDTLGADGNWRGFAQIGGTSAGIMTVVSYSAGTSQVSALWWYQYKGGGTGGYVSRLSGNSVPQFRLSGQQIQHSSGGGVHYVEARTLPLVQ